MIFLLKMLSTQYRARRNQVLSARRAARAARFYRKVYEVQEEYWRRVKAGFVSLSDAWAEKYPDARQTIRFVQYQPTKEGQ